jgi:hypothetical protein
MPQGNTNFSKLSGRAAGAITKNRVVFCSGITADGILEFTQASDKDNAVITTPHLPIGVAAATVVDGDQVEVLCGEGAVLLIEAGAATTEGRLQTFDANGRVIDIAEVASQYVTYCGVGTKVGALGVLIPVVWQPGFISKPAA